MLRLPHSILTCTLTACLIACGGSEDSDNKDAGTDSSAPDAASEDASTPTRVALIDEGFTGCQGGEDSAIHLRLVAEYEGMGTNSMCAYVDFGPAGEAHDVNSTPSTLKLLMLGTGTPPCALSASSEVIHDYNIGGATGSVTVEENSASLDITYNVLGAPMPIQLKSEGVDVSAACSD